MWENENMCDLLDDDDEVMGIVWCLLICVPIDINVELYYHQILDVSTNMFALNISFQIDTLWSRGHFM